MKNIKNMFGLLFLAGAFVGQPLYGAQTQVKSVDASVKRVDKEMSLLDQIVEQANIVVDEADQKARTQAKRKLTKLMESKELDKTIKDAIWNDVGNIITPLTKREMYAAHIRLLNTYAEIDSQANVVEAIARATKMVQDASPEELDEVLIEAKQIIEKAEDEQLGLVVRWYAKAKRMVAAPVDYVFGEENSKAKTAFYAAVGLAVLAAGVYGYQYYAERKLLAEKNWLLGFKLEREHREAERMRMEELGWHLDESGQLRREPLPVISGVPKQNTIDEIIDGVYTIQKQRIPLQEEENYWKTMHALAVEGKRPALSQAELNNEKEITDQLYSLYNQEDALETTLWKSRLVVDADKAVGMIKRAKYDYDVSREAKSERNLYKQKFEQKLDDYYSNNYKTPEN